jgi:hypothetical protein
VRPLELAEIADLESYARLRDGYRRAVIAHKQGRRLAVGEQVTLVFEDRETLRFQVQEMLLVERISEPERVQHELDVYNELMPGPRELSATLFIEIEEQARIRPELDRLVGIDEHVALRLGEGAGARRIRARFDQSQLEEERISAVHYIRFPLDAAGVAQLADPKLGAAIEIDHPSYSRVAPLPEALRANLCAGLARDPEPLLVAPPAQAAPDALVCEVGALRVVARRGSPTDLLVVASGTSAARWLAGDAAFGADLEEALRRAARHVARHAGAARIESQLADGDGSLRWRVTGPSGR